MLVNKYISFRGYSSLLIILILLISSCKLWQECIYEKSMPSNDNIEHGELFNKLMSEQAKSTYIGLPSKGFFICSDCTTH